MLNKFYATFKAESTAKLGDVGEFNKFSKLFHDCEQNLPVFPDSSFCFSSK